MFRLTSLIVAMGLYLSAQTKLPIGQVGAPSQPQPRVLIVLPSGAVTFAQIDSSLSLDLTTSPPTLKAAAATSAQQQFVRMVKGAADGAWIPAAPVGSTAPACNPWIVFRNGLVQWPGSDYDMTSTGGVTFRQGVDMTDPSLPADAVSAVCK